METQHDCKIKKFRTDNGGEFLSDKITEFFTQKGIRHDLTPPYSHESNGVAERFNRSVGEGIRAMLLPIDNKRLWAEATNTFVYVKNLQAHSIINGMTPHEAFYDEKPSVSHLQPFGRKCYVHISKERRSTGNKLLPRAEMGMFVGYTKVAHHYRIFIPKRNHTYVSANVEFLPFTSTNSITYPSNDTAKLNDDPILPHKSAEIDVESQSSIHSIAYNDSTYQDQNEIIHENLNPINSATEIIDTNSTINQNNQQTLLAPLSLMPENVPQQSLTSPTSANPTQTTLQNSDTNQNHYRRTQSGRQVRPRTFDDTITGNWWNSTNSSHESPSNLLYEEEALINILEIPVPKSYNMAKNSVHWDQWKTAFDDEINSLQENNVWEIVPRPEGRKIIDGKWVCKVKGNSQGELERFKARYVAKGFSQTQGLDYDETFAPVVRY
ncbi:hypothetical protein K3495_g15484, partial [Podosphaera aphanis]